MRTVAVILAAPLASAAIACSFARQEEGSQHRRILGDVHWNSQIWTGRSKMGGKRCGR